MMPPVSPAASSRRRAVGCGSLLPVFALVVLTGPGCGSEPTPQEPEGGYLAFREALLSGHPDRLSEWDSEDTKQLYRDAIQDLAALAESVEQLSPADRAVAYERTALRLAQHVETGEDLFNELVRLDDLPGDERYRLGTEVDEVIVPSENADTASVRTRAGQTFELVREADGVWRVSSLASMAQAQLRAIAENLSAVDVLAAESAYMRRSHTEIVRLLGGTPEPEGTGVGAGDGSGRAE